MIEVRIPGALLGTERRRHDDAKLAVSDERGVLQVIKPRDAGQPPEIVGEYGPGRWVSWRTLDADAVRAAEEARNAAAAEERATRLAEATAREAEVALRREELAEAHVAEAEVGELELLEGFGLLGIGSQVQLAPGGLAYVVRSLSAYDSGRTVEVGLEAPGLDGNADAAEAPVEDLS